MARIECLVLPTILHGDEVDEVDGVEARCSRCGHVTEAYGDSPASIKRCLLTLRKQCPRGEKNYYVERVLSRKKRPRK